MLSPVQKRARSQQSRQPLVFHPSCRVKLSYGSRQAAIDRFDLAEACAVVRNTYDTTILQPLPIVPPLSSFALANSLGTPPARRTGEIQPKPDACSGWSAPSSSVHLLYLAVRLLRGFSCRPPAVLGDMVAMCRANACVPNPSGSRTSPSLTRREGQGPLRVRALPDGAYGAPG